MIRSKTVFVVGAGASCEYKFPSGAELLQNIAGDLDINFSFTEQKSGDTAVMHGIRQHHAANSPNDNINLYLHAGRRLRDAARIARSIDNAIDQNDLDPLVPVVAKLAIAREILKAEAASRLKSDNYTDRFARPSGIVGTWLHELGQILTTDIKASKADSIFENVSFIVFNYDRAIEYAIPSMIQMAYGLTDDACIGIGALCKIWHPYGSLGSIRFGSDNFVPFGGSASLDLVSKGIRTFGESLADDAPLNEWREALAEASQIVFVGFGFHRPNIELLTPAEGFKADRVVATIYNEYIASVSVIREFIDRITFYQADKRHVTTDLVNLKAHEVLKQYHLRITG